MSFGDDETETALADVTNKVNGIKINEEVVKRARDAGFAEPEKYDYDTYNKSNRDQALAAPAEEGEVDNEPLWATDAARYEWTGDVGDLGPEDKQLEKMLFGTELRNTKGYAFEK